MNSGGIGLSSEWEAEPDQAGIAHEAGERLVPFPRCPKCGGHALYRNNGIGNFECLTCGHQAITEEAARGYVSGDE
jgi:predicted RNA-binding Zn-ribbon protein involved in translation (DUF1610 family)